MRSVLNAKIMSGGKQQLGKGFPKFNGSTGLATGYDFKNRLKRQNEIRDMEWASLPTVATARLLRGPNVE